MKNMYLIIGVILLLNTTISYAKKSKTKCDGSQDNPCIVIDTDNNTVALKHYRDAAMLAKTYLGNTTGLKNLKLSGSAAEGQNDWRNIFKLIKNKTVKKIIDLDLRQESHGYLNGQAINLTSNNDWININKSISQVTRLEKKWLSTLKQQSSIENVLTPKQFKSHQYTSGIPIAVKSISDEKKLVQQIGFYYVRLAVTDHMAPRDTEVDHFTKLIKTMDADTWLHVHCRGGSGRTTTFMAMFDMFKNADKVSFDEIIKRQAAVKPYYNLSIVNRKNLKYTRYYKERLAFLFNFYKFSIDHLNGYDGNWSIWKRDNLIKRKPLT